MLALLPPYLFHLMFVNIQLFAKKMRDIRWTLDNAIKIGDHQNIEKL